MQFVRNWDNVPVPADTSAIDTAVFPGLWLNTNHHTSGTAMLKLAVDGGKLTVRGVGAGADGLIDWETASDTTLYCGAIDSKVGSAFSTQYDFGFMETRLEGNVNRGVLVLAAYNSFKDDSGRINYFCREYFAQAANPFGASATDVKASRLDPNSKVTRKDDRLFGLAKDGAAADASPMRGHWHNSNPATQGMREITINLDGPQPTMHVIGVGADGPIDWGQQHGTLYTCIEEDGRPSPVLAVLYDFDFMQIYFQIRVNRGILVPACFNVFKDDSGRSNYFTREFFFRREH